jgi:hypothetical protein
MAYCVVIGSLFFLWMPVRWLLMETDRRFQRLDASTEVCCTSLVSVQLFSSAAMDRFGFAARLELACFHTMSCGLDDSVDQPIHQWSDVGSKEIKLYDLIKQESCYTTKGP